MTDDHRAEGPIPAATPGGRRSSDRSRLIGRDRELSEVAGLLAPGRLVTLVGSPGIGKTRLAHELVDTGGAAPDAGTPLTTYVVQLATVVDAREVGGMVASVVGLQEAGAAPVGDRLVEGLRHRPARLVLDNCEHVAAACRRLVEQLLAGCPMLSVLATSRRPLGVGGEQVVRLAPLTVPPSLATGSAVGGFDAVRLFAARAGAVRPSFDLEEAGFEVVAEICRRLDGVPLALELAAARVEILAPAQILDRLDNRFALLVDEEENAHRHPTLEAAVDWSYDLLAPPEQVLLRRLAVFVGGCSIDAAERVCTGAGLGQEGMLSALTRLVSSSLLVAPTAGGEARYSLLETIRDYGRARLAESGEEAETRRRHAEWCLELAQRAEPELVGPAQDRWLGRLDAEAPNLAAGFRWALAEGRSDLTLGLVSTLTLWWRVRGRFSEGHSWAVQALEPASGPISMQARAHLCSGFMAVMMGHPDAPEALHASLAVAEELGDLRTSGRALLVIANHLQQTDNDGALERYDRAIARARQVGDSWCLAHGLALSAYCHVHLDDMAEGRRRLEEALAVARQAGDAQGLAFTLNELAVLALAHSDLWAAQTHLRQAVRMAQQTGQLYEQVTALTMLGRVALEAGDHDEATTRLDEALHLAGRLGSRRGAVGALAHRARVRHALGDLAAARLGFEDALSAAAPTMDSNDRGGILLALSQIAEASGHHAPARALLNEASAGVGTMPRRFAARLRLTAGQLDRAEGDRSRAARAYVEACRQFRDVHDPKGVADCLDALGGLDAGSRPSRAAELFEAATAIRQAHGLARFVPTCPDYDEDVRLAHDRLPDAALASAAAVGRAMGIDEAVAAACDRPEGDDAPVDGWARLTPTERNVVAVVTEGLTNIEVGERLGISARTVETHLTHVYAKLGVATRTALARLAARRGSGERVSSAE